MAALLNVENLRVSFGRGVAVDGISFAVDEGETVALVGESGCGKSVTALSIARLVPQPPGNYESGQILWRGRNVLAMDEAALRRLRGADMAYIFQEPTSSLNPVYRVGWQILEALRIHRPAEATRDTVVRLLEMVGLPDPHRRLRAYPHEMSGGQQQRVMIAMALACRPRLIVADEPTTALDVTTQKQILDLLDDLQRELRMAVLLITHNLGLVAGHARRVYVMYAGRIAEAGPVQQVLRRPRHPYTRGLLDAVPKLSANSGRLTGIEGMVPSIAHPPSGCRFHPRCPRAQPLCAQQTPALQTYEDEVCVACHFPEGA